MLYMTIGVGTTGFYLVLLIQGSDGKTSDKVSISVTDIIDINIFF